MEGRLEPAAMRGGGVRQSGRAVATKELEVARRNSCELVTALDSVGSQDGATRSSSAIRAACAKAAVATCVEANLPFYPLCLASPVDRKRRSPEIK